ncbi:ABC transporter ATP-binding protein, partial [uncultured Clostridium sp.]|uniref:ABC transporter ATP-binding protein n=1 Tax=uncultured Clostridium sp. TaxID=59620 RepID=UPI002599AC5D
MFTLKNIKKSYKTANFIQIALDGVSVNFRKNEFVTILGPSGSGKTTCLNVIGGLDKYDSGDLIINGRSTKEFNDTDWDAYRNNSIGFIFQSYNLINNLDIISNVEMGMTLSGVSQKEKREKALDALERVGLKDHVHKRPNQLSGGQMQRVA